VHLDNLTGVDLSGTLDVEKSGEMMIDLPRSIFRDSFLSLLRLSMLEMLSGRRFEVGKPNTD
jgi:hypothetical protein